VSKFGLFFLQGNIPHMGCYPIFQSTLYLFYLNQENNPKYHSPVFLSISFRSLIFLLSFLIHGAQDLFAVQYGKVIRYRPLNLRGNGSPKCFHSTRFRVCLCNAGHRIF